MDDVSETVSIMAAEGCEEMSGNGELEESSGSFIAVARFAKTPHICRFTDAAAPLFHPRAFGLKTPTGTCFKGKHDMLG